jgi:hypothetical protein
MVFPHETHPMLALELAPAIRARMLLSPLQEEGAPCIGVHLRCSDVPEVQNPMYELIEFDWYARACSLLPDIKNVTLLACGGHMPTGSDFCRRYAESLAAFLRERGYSVAMSLACGTPEGDFCRILGLSAFVSGGCGGSYGFWAGALREGPSVLPCPKGANFCELGIDALVRRGNKVLLDAQRVDNGALQNLSGDHELSLCRSIVLATGESFDGTAFYINRDSAVSRRNHCVELLRRVGMRPVRWTASEIPDGGRGCCLSHLSLLRHVAAGRPSGWTLIVEDDVEFHEESRNIMELVAEEARKAHLFLFLGICDPQPTGEYSSGRCSHAYMVTGEGAARLTKAIEMELALAPAVHVDVVYERHVCARVVRPGLVSPVQQPDCDKHTGLGYQARDSSWYLQ